MLKTLEKLVFQKILSKHVYFVDKECIFYLMPAGLYVCLSVCKRITQKVLNRFSQNWAEWCILAIGKIKLCFEENQC